MEQIFKISTINYSGYSANITFNPLTGGTINIGTVTLPYYYSSNYYYGQYEIYIPDTGVTCTFSNP